MSGIPQAASASPMPDSVTNPNYRPLPGRLGNLTVIQLHTLEKFKKELKEEGHFVEERMDDAMLLRWGPLFCVDLCDLLTCGLYFFLFFSYFANLWFVRLQFSLDVFLESGNRDYLSYRSSIF